MSFSACWCLLPSNWGGGLEIRSMHVCICLSVCLSVLAAITSCFYHTALVIYHSIAWKLYWDTSQSSILDKYTHDLALTPVTSITMLRSIWYLSLYSVSKLNYTRTLLTSIYWMHEFNHNLAQTSATRPRSHYSSVPLKQYPSNIYLNSLTSSEYSQG